MKTGENNDFKTLSKHIAKNPRSSLEYLFNLINFFTPLAGAVYLILLHESYKQDSYKVYLKILEIKKYLNYKMDMNVVKGLKVLDMLGIIKMEKYGHSYTYTLLNPEWDDILREALSEKTFNYFIDKICISTSKKRNAERHRNKFGKYFHIEKQKNRQYEFTNLVQVISSIKENGIEELVKRYEDIKWKTRNRRYKSIGFNLGILVPTSTTLGPTSTILVPTSTTLGPTSTTLGPTAKISGGLFIPTKQTNPEHDLNNDYAPIMPHETDVFLTSKGLKAKRLKRDKRTQISNVSNMYTVTIQKPNDCSSNYIVMQLKKAIKKWNSNYPIFQSSELTLEEAVSPIRKYKLKKEQIYQYAEYVIYHEYLKVKVKTNGYLCSWFKKPERIERFLQHIAVEKQEEEEEGFERYKREHKAKLVAKENMGGRAGHAYEKSEKRLKEDYEFDKLTPEQKREEIWKSLDLGDEWMDFIKRKMLKNYRGVTVAVQYFRRKSTGKVYILCDGSGYWRKDKLQDILDGKDIDVDLDACTPEGDGK